MSSTRLYCMNGGHHLQILPDGTVCGQRDETDVHGDTGYHIAQRVPEQIFLLQLKAVAPGVVVIQGRETGTYLAMNEDGRLYASPSVNDECHFLERLEENHYNTYQSHKYRENSWYVALKKNGKPKLGPRTHIGQKAIFFLPRRLTH
ncbi:putative fibroblast growth factor 1 isoform X1 [Corythoichthys intestinalis]|uniref:putative fibroblast growth factor 1 isoform X1 n=1 Tax=Corythoichthys intestinalis TaxID=161448 RepID=UPI0025A688FB|nr:putative fibroblast growth factor 1 isoform X1 [Corythoichthys intestinalis]